jgi:hypothetical protein
MGQVEVAKSQPVFGYDASGEKVWETFSSGYRDIRYGGLEDLCARLSYLNRIFQEIRYEIIQYWRSGSYGRHYDAP